MSGKIIDTMIASALVDENQMRYDLNSCAKRYTGKTKSESDLYSAAKEKKTNPIMVSLRMYDIL